MEGICSRLCILVVTISATLRVARLQTATSRPNVGSCSLQTLEEELIVGPMDTPGLVAASYDTGDGSPTPTVRIWNSRILCQASGASRDTLSSFSVVVFYECSMGVCGSVPVNRTDQFQFDCQTRVNGGPGNFFSPTKSLGRSIRTPSVGITRLMATPSVQCGDCSQSNVSAGLDTLQPDNVTHCVACRSECQVGLGKCLGLNAGQCCSFYENDQCVVSCTAPLVPDAEHECGCGPLVVANTVITFSDGAKIGSVATQTCDASAGFMPSSSSTATRMCTMDGWGRADIACQIATCSASDFITGTAGSTDPEDGPFNFGATATFSCDPGHELVCTRECTVTGWSGFNPTCSVLNQTQEATTPPTTHPTAREASSCSLSIALASVITALATALLTTAISVLVQIAVYRHHPKFTPRSVVAASLAGGEEEQRDEGQGGVAETAGREEEYDQIDEGQGGVAETAGMEEEYDQIDEGQGGVAETEEEYEQMDGSGGCVAETPGREEEYEQMDGSGGGVAGGDPTYMEIGAGRGGGGGENTFQLEENEAYNSPSTELY